MEESKADVFQVKVCKKMDLFSLHNIISIEYIFITSQCDIP